MTHVDYTDYTPINHLCYYCGNLGLAYHFVLLITIQQFFSQYECPGVRSFSLLILNWAQGQSDAEE